MNSSLLGRIRHGKKRRSSWKPFILVEAAQLSEEDILKIKRYWTDKYTKPFGINIIPTSNHLIHWYDWASSSQSQYCETYQ